MTTFVEGSKTLDEGVQALIDGAIADYTQRQTTYIAYIYGMGRRDGVEDTPEQAENRARRCKEQTEESIAEYTNSMRFKKGGKYIKVIEGNEVHCFIVATADDEQFNLGDVLKAESWSRPARNRARGNVFTGFHIEWTGALYL
jgi:hypothetical protein